MFYRRHKKAVLVVVGAVAIVVSIIVLSPIPHWVRMRMDDKYAVMAMFGSDFYSYTVVSDSDRAILVLEHEISTRSFLTHSSMRRICEFYNRHRRNKKDCAFARTLHISAADEDRRFLSLYIQAINQCEKSGENEDISFIERYTIENGFIDECEVVERYLRSK